MAASVGPRQRAAGAGSGGGRPHSSHHTQLPANVIMEWLIGGGRGRGRGRVREGEEKGETEERGGSMEKGKRRRQRRGVRKTYRKMLCIKRWWKYIRKEIS